MIGTEITESVNARKIIETSDLASRTILESSPDCLKLLELDGRIQYIIYNGLCQIVSLIEFSNTEKSNLDFAPCNLNNVIEESKSDF